MARPPEGQGSEAPIDPTSPGSDNCELSDDFPSHRARPPPTATLCMPGFPPSPRVRCRKVFMLLTTFTTYS